MATSDDPLFVPGVPVGYRTVNSTSSMWDDETASSIGDSTSGSRRSLKPRLILGKAWSRSVRWLKARRRGEAAARLVDRTGHFHQSIGRWNIRRLKSQADLKKLVGLDPFHTFVNQTTFKIIVGIMSMYLGIVFVFAIVYKLISSFLGCNLDLASMRESFLFSLETMSTVGYGTSDYLFGGCWLMLPVLSLQACMGLLIDAFLIGILFARLSRPQTRASTVVFTKHAIIRRVRGESFFMFQVGELRKHQLLETRVRCYALRHERLNRQSPEESRRAGGASPTSNGDGVHVPGGRSIGSSVAGSIGGSMTGRGITPIEGEPKQPDQVYFQCHSMRLQHPDDELGANLLLVLPQTVVHRIDAWSPMMPPPRWNSSHGVVQWGFHQDKGSVRAPWQDCEEEPAPDKKHDADGGPTGTSYGSPGANGDSQFLSGDDAGRLKEGQLGKQDSLNNQYWEESSISESGFNANERSAKCEDNRVGYVHRFPDLLKRWDDVDGDRGTWYEVMKRRMMRVEMERREEEKQRAMKLAKEAQTAASTNRLLRAGFRRVMDRRASIMHIGGPATPVANPFSNEDLADGVNKLKDRGLGPVSEGDEMLLHDTEAGSTRSLASGSPPLGYSGSDPCLFAPGGGVAAAAIPAKVRTPAQWFAREERKAIDAYVQDRELEVVVILEGIDTSTGSTVQARHSYCWEDILWDRTFASCVTRGEDGACEVDFSKFHDTVKAPEDCVDHGFVQSYA